jgi:hypothetical protein
MFDGIVFTVFHPDDVRDMRCNIVENMTGFNYSTPLLLLDQYIEDIRNDDGISDIEGCDPMRYIARIRKYRQREFEIRISDRFKIRVQREIVPLDGLTVGQNDIRSWTHKRIHINDNGPITLCSQEKYFYVTEPFEIDTMFDNKGRALYTAKITEAFKVTGFASPRNITFGPKTRFIHPLTYDIFVRKVNTCRYRALVSIWAIPTLRGAFIKALEIQAINPVQGQNENGLWNSSHEDPKYGFSYKLCPGQYIYHRHGRQIIQRMAPVDLPQVLIDLIFGYMCQYDEIKELSMEDLKAVVDHKNR